MVVDEEDDDEDDDDDEGEKEQRKLVRKGMKIQKQLRHKLEQACINYLLPVLRLRKALLIEQLIKFFSFKTSH